MRKLLKRTLALLLCLAMLGGFAVVPQVNAQSAETLPPIDLTQFGNQVVYGKAGETTFVPAGYTFVYEDENGREQIVYGDVVSGYYNEMIGE